MTLLRN